MVGCVHVVYKQGNTIHTYVTSYVYINTTVRFAVNTGSRQIIPVK
jgi:hypothetical protein